MLAYLFVTGEGSVLLLDASTALLQVIQFEIINLIAMLPIFAETTNRAARVDAVAFGGQSVFHFISHGAHPVVWVVMHTQNASRQPTISEMSSHFALAAKTGEVKASSRLAAMRVFI